MGEPSTKETRQPSNHVSQRLHRIKQIDGLVKKSSNRRHSKKLQMQGARILRNEAYLSYVATTKDGAQRRSWTFSEAVKIEMLEDTD